MRNDIQADDAEKSLAPADKQNIENEKLAMYQCPQGYIVNHPSQCRENNMDITPQPKLPKLELG